MSDRRLDPAARDPIGHRVHLAVALTYCAVLPVATVPKDIAFGVLLGCAAARLWLTWRTYRPVIGDLVSWTMVAWFGWTALSLSWSTDPALGQEDLHAGRFVFTAAALWPVLQRPSFFVVALLLGVLVQNGCQLAAALHWFDLEPGPHGRLHPMLNPIQTATMCATGMCLHLAAFGRGSGMLRVAAALGLLAAAAGLLATGSRGVWIATALGLPLVAVQIGRRGGLRRLAVPGLAIALLGGAILITRGGFVIERVQQAVTDVRSATTEGQYKSDVGLRLANWREAGRAVRSAPIAGIGAGSFREFARQSPHTDVLNKTYHAHSLYLHVLATTGLLGAALAAAALGAVLLRAARATDDPPFMCGALPAIVIWMIAAAFDAYHLSGQLFGLLMLLSTLTLASRRTLYPPHS